MHVPTQVQVEIENAALQPTAEAVADNPGAVLDLGPPAGVEAGLGQQMAGQPLEADEGERFRAFNSQEFCSPSYSSPRWPSRL